MLMLTSLKFLNKNYMELRHSAEHGFQQNILNFITNKSHTWDFDSLVKSYGKNAIKAE